MSEPRAAPFQPPSPQHPLQASVPNKRKKSAAADGADASDKRAKTPRACDSCRTKKIRCMPADDELAAAAVPPKCKYCLSHGLTCTWYLPIAQTRWKNKGGKPPNQAEKQQQQQQFDGQGSNPSPNTPLNGHTPTGYAQPSPHATPGSSSSYFPSNSSSVPYPSSSSGTALPPVQPGHQQQHPLSQERPASSGYSSHPPEPTASAPASRSPQIAQKLPSLPPASTLSMPPMSQSMPSRVETRMLGASSIPQLLHDTSSFPTERFPPVMNRVAHTWEVMESHGFVKLFQSRESQVLAKNRNLDSSVTSSTTEQLVNVYLNTLAPFFPILSRADFLTSTPLEPTLLWTTVGVAALSHKVPPYVLRAIKTNVSVVSRETDMLASMDLQNVQAHLIFAMSLEMERGDVGTRVWNSLGLAIRMAQNLGLHRENDSENEVETKMHHVELRRRVWGGCIIADRWIGAIFGLPQMIDLSDCDRLYPSEHEFLPGRRADEVDTTSKPFLGMPAQIELAILLGDVLKLIYSPTGLAGVKDDQLERVKASLINWQQQLPEELQFTDPDTAQCMAGFLSTSFVPVLFLFYRPFMKPCNKLSENHGIHFMVTQAEFLQLCDMAGKVIQWLDRFEHILESWGIAVYSLFICALIQYHHCVRNRDEGALQMLRRAVHILTRTANEECWARGRITEVVCVLEHTAVSLQNVTGASSTQSAHSTPVQNYGSRPASATLPPRYQSTPNHPSAPVSYSLSHQPRGSVTEHNAHFSFDPVCASGPASMPTTSNSLSISDASYHSAGLPNSMPGQTPTTSMPSSGPQRISSGMQLDLQQPFTFLPGSDFVAPGPSQGPLSFDPYFPSDPGQWQALMNGLEEAATQPAPMPVR